MSLFGLMSSVCGRNQVRSTRQVCLAYIQVLWRVSQFGALGSYSSLREPWMPICTVTYSGRAWATTLQKLGHSGINPWKAAKAVCLHCYLHSVPADDLAETIIGETLKNQASCYLGIIFCSKAVISFPGSVNIINCSILNSQRERERTRKGCS